MTRWSQMSLILALCTACPETWFVRPSTQALYPLCITVSVLALAYSLNTVADVRARLTLRAGHPAGRSLSL
jgi:hypothetical protein